MTTLTITRGLPGSGKTTYALDVVRFHKTPTIRVNRDDIRQARFGKTHGLDTDQEKEVTLIARAQASGALKAGIDVVVDDTNLHKDSVKGWIRLAFDHDAQFHHVDFDIDVEESVRRAKIRAERGGREVPEEVIRRMHKRYFKDDKFPPLPEVPTPPVETYVPDTSKRRAYVVDIDGTMTLGPHRRSPYEWHKVGQDLINKPVRRVVEALSDHTRIIFLSGRDESCRAETELWLRDHVDAGWWDLHMRPEGDWRRDDIIKQELFDKHVRYNYNVVGIFDDRAQVVRQWRRIGLPVFQVADGDF